MQVLLAQLVTEKNDKQTTTADLSNRIDAMITERMQAASIVDVMIDTERWLDLHKLFRPLAGTDSRLADLRMRVITTLFCYGGSVRISVCEAVESVTQS